MGTAEVAAVLVIGILAIGCCALIYAMYVECMKHSRQVWNAAEKYRDDVWIRSLNERKQHTDTIKTYQAHIELLLRERRDELSKVHSAIEMAKISLMKEVHQAVKTVFSKDKS